MEKLKTKKSLKLQAVTYRKSILYIMVAKKAFRSLTSLSYLYGISNYSFKKYIKPLSIVERLRQQKRRLLSPNEQSVIIEYMYEKYGFEIMRDRI